MRCNSILRAGRLLASCLLVLAGALALTAEFSVAQAQTAGNLDISPDTGAVGSTFQVHGTGFVNFSLVTRTLDLAVFDADNQIIARGSVDARDDGSFDTYIDTSKAAFSSGTYSLLASYTYWGARRDAYTNAIVCDFCPVKTVPLADPVTFTVE